MPPSIAWCDGPRRTAPHCPPAYGARARRAYPSADRARQRGYLKLVDARQVKWQDRAHFFAMSSRLMRQVLVDWARARGYQKRGAGAHNVTLDEGRVGVVEQPADVIALDDALKALEQIDPRKSQVVELRFFGGLSIEETAEALDMSVRTVKRDWTMAKLWLLRELKKK